MFQFITFDENENPELLETWKKEMTFDRYQAMLTEYYEVRIKILNEEIESFFTPRKILNVRPEIVEITKNAYRDLIDIHFFRTDLLVNIELYEDLVIERKVNTQKSESILDIIRKNNELEWNKRQKELEHTMESIIKNDSLSTTEIRFLNRHTDTKDVESFYQKRVFPTIEKETRIALNDYLSTGNKNKELKSFNLLLTNRHWAAIREGTMKKNLTIINNYIQASLTIEKSALSFIVDDELESNSDLQHYIKIKNRSRKNKDDVSVMLLKDSMTPSTRLLIDLLGEKIISSNNEGSDLSINISVNEYMQKLNLDDPFYAKAQLATDLHLLSCGRVSFHSDYTGEIVTSELLKYFIHYKSEKNNLIYQGKIGADAQISYIKIVFSDWIKIIQRKKQKQYIHASQKHYDLNSQKYPHASDLSFSLHRFYRINDKKMNDQETWNRIKLDSLLAHIDITEHDIKKRGKEYYKNKIRDTLSYLESEKHIFEVKNIDKETIEYRPTNFKNALLDKRKSSRKK